VTSQRSTLNSQPSVDLHIEELVLDGFAPGDRHTIGDAVEIELRELLVKHRSVPWSVGNGEIDRIDAGEFKIVTGATAQTIGGHVAESINHMFLGLRHSAKRRT
jgi:hypothetical protein